jgi:hypothetical protein
MRTAGKWLGEGDGRNGLGVGPLHNFLLAHRTLHKTIANHNARKQKHTSGGCD